MLLRDANKVFGLESTGGAGHQKSDDFVVRTTFDVKRRQLRMRGCWQGGVFRVSRKFRVWVDGNGRLTGSQGLLQMIGRDRGTFFAAVH